MTIQTATHLTVQRLAKGDRILYPCWDAKTVTDQPRTVAYIVEYPENRVLYFVEGGYGIADRGAVVQTLALAQGDEAVTR